MSDPTGQPPSSDASDESVKPRPVASRHFRQQIESPDAAAGPPGSGGHESEARDDEELAELTQKFKDLVGRKRAAPAEPPAEEEAKVRRRPMPRSGNVNMALLVGVTQAPNESPERIMEVEPPRVIFPSGLSALTWKLAIVAVVMFGLGYFAATLLRPAGPAVAPAPVTPEMPPAWRPSQLEILGRAAAADRAGDLKTATALLSELAASEPKLPGLARYQADLLIRQGNYVMADTALLAQVTAGREVASSLYLRAFNAARQRHFDDAAHYLQGSIANDPLSADTYYQLAELLRRQGKLAEAIDHGKRALLRVQPGYGISPATIALKMRLAQIESGQLAEVAAALAAAQNSSPLAPEWLFTAAALSLQKGDLAAASESLARARDVMPRDEFIAWVEDYFFKLHTVKPELSKFQPTEEERLRRQRSSWEFSLDP